MDIAREHTNPFKAPSKGDLFKHGLWWTRNAAGSRVVDTPTSNPQLLLAIIACCHDGMAGHAGVFGTTNLVRATWYWKHMDKLIRRFIHACLLCASFKGPNKTTVPMGTLPQAFRPFAIVAFDFFKMPMSKRGNDSILVFVDVFSTLVNIFPCNQRTVPVVVRAFMSWIKHYCVPFTLICDRDPAFVSKLTTELWKVLDVLVAFSHAYVKQGNSYAERAGQAVGQALQLMCGELGHRADMWEDVIDITQTTINTVPRRKANLSAVNQAFGFPSDSFTRVQFSDDFSSFHAIPLTEAQIRIAEETRERLAWRNEVVDKANRADAEEKFLASSVGKYTSLPLAVGSNVMIANEDQKGILTLRWSQIGQVVERIDNWSYMVRHLDPAMENSTPILYHVSWLKPLGSSFNENLSNAERLRWLATTREGIAHLSELRLTDKDELQVHVIWMDASKAPTWLPVKDLIARCPILFQDMLLQPLPELILDALRGLTAPFPDPIRFAQAGD